MRNYNNCTKDIICNGCEKLVNQNKEFSANLNEIKRQPPNEFGHMLPNLLSINLIYHLINGCKSKRIL